MRDAHVPSGDRAAPFGISQPRFVTRGISRPCRLQSVRLSRFFRRLSEPRQTVWETRRIAALANGVIFRELLLCVRLCARARALHTSDER
jgi:hypothetical protein